MFYIYEWYIIDTNEVIYVGKGSKKRYLSKQHNNIFKEFIKRYNCKSRIIEYFENEQEAYKKEFERINELKDIGQCVCNKCIGGNGGGASINTKMKRWTEEEREKYSKNNVMKAKNQRQRMIENNPMKNKEYAMKNGLLHRKPFFVGNLQFQTLQEASLYYNKKPQTIKDWLKKGHSPTDICYYINEVPKEFNFTKNRHISRNIKIIYDNVEYNSIKDLAKFLNIEYTKVHKYFKRNKPINGKFITRQSATKP